MLIEHLEGPSLRSLLKRHGALPLEQVLPLCAHVAAALHYMAEVEILHLDVKPDNIIMGVPPRLIDLSIATPLAEAATLRVARHGRVVPRQSAGAPSVASPPICSARPSTTRSGDVPFPRERGAGSSETPTVRWQQLAGAPRPLPGISPMTCAR